MNAMTDIKRMLVGKRVLAGLALFMAVMAVAGCNRSAPAPLDCRLLNPSGTTQVLMLGNSLLHDFDWSLPAAQVFNCAKQGQTLNEFRARWRTGSLPLEQPDVVVMAFGTVEVIRAEREPRHLQEFMASYPGFLADLRQRWPEARLVVNLLPEINRELFGRPHLDIAAIDQLNRFIRQSTTCGGCQVIDLPEVLTRGESGFDETLTYDGVHLTAQAYDQWRDALARILAP